MWYRDFYPRSQPRQAKGGIKAQSKRGQFGQSWWAKRWISVLESFNIGARLQRGRTYARQGQVLSVNIDKGKVTAKVQGSRPKPYEVAIQVKALSGKEWDKLGQQLATQALFTAKLLAGEMPQDIEKAFQDAGLSLFPKKRDDLTTDCSCPDWSNPCKHVAAVYYLLGEEFDRDPFLIFRLRGLTREELMDRLHEQAPVAPVPSSKREKVTETPTARGVGKPTDNKREAPRRPEPLPTDSKAFWSMGEVPANLFEGVTRPSVAAAWPKRLGNFPFWRGQQRFLDALENIYHEAGRYGLEVFLGEQRAGEGHSG